jgi:hypothetical protein
MTRPIISSKNFTELMRHADNQIELLQLCLEATERLRQSQRTVVDSSHEKPKPLEDKPKE